MNTVDEYVDSYDGVKKEWLTTFVNFMRENYPDAEEKISYKIPTYKLKDRVVYFSVAKDHFSLHALHGDLIEELRNKLPRAKFGQGSAQVKYSDRDSIPILFEMIQRILGSSEAEKP